METQITEKMIRQYEAIRSSGAINMFDYYGVHGIADKLEFFDLASLTREEYGFLLCNFGKLMKKYGVVQNTASKIKEDKQ